MAVTILRPHHTKYKWKHAVGVRAKPAREKIVDSNPLAFSQDRPEERTMDWRARGEIILPSGFKVSESWAAIRKSWHGYKSALKDGDAQKAKMYAWNINKVQKELGIPVTPFEILSLEDYKNLEMEMSHINAAADSQRAAKVHEISREIGINERTVDYDSVMHDAKNELINMPPARKEIFAPYHSREDKACAIEIEDPMSEAIKATETVMHDTHGCYYEFNPEKIAKRKKHQQKRMRKSCYFVSNTPLGAKNLLTNVSGDIN